MSDTTGQAWGMCAAFGCPLFGTLGHDGQWYCFCHAGKPSVFNDAITRELRERQMPIVEATLSIRRHFSSFYDAPEAYRAIQNKLIGMDRRDLLFNANGKDTPPSPPCRPGMKPVVKMWLARLEAVLIEACAEIGQQKRIATTVQTAKVIGPTHASNFHPYADGEAA
jgi:hypothetical protein